MKPSVLYSCRKHSISSLYPWWNLRQIGKECSQLHGLTCWVWEDNIRFLKKKLEVKDLWTGGNSLCSWACEVEKIKQAIVLTDALRESSVLRKSESLPYNFIPLLCPSHPTGIWYDVGQCVILCLCDGNQREHVQICKKITSFFLPPFHQGSVSPY